MKIFNIGYFGFGKYSAKNNKEIYGVWYSILRRCYDNKYQLLRPTYIDCYVDEKWHNFQVFAEWYELNYICDFDIDKDILIKGNKIYGPEKCCFVPKQINNLFLKSNNSRGNLPIGVSINNQRPGIKAHIRKFGKLKALGTFKTIEEAFNIYKIEKEKYIKEVAEIWKNKITENVYISLINYKVEITD